MIWESWKFYRTFDGKDPAEVLKKDSDVVAAVVEDIFHRRHKESAVLCQQEALERLPKGWDIGISLNAVSSHYYDCRPVSDRRFTVPTITRWDHRDGIEKAGFVRYKATECGWCGAPWEDGRLECPSCGGS